MTLCFGFHSLFAFAFTSILFMFSNKLDKLRKILWFWLKYEEMGVSGSPSVVVKFASQDQGVPDASGFD